MMTADLDAEQVDGLVTYVEHLEQVYGRGLTYRELREHVTDPDTDDAMGEPALQDHLHAAVTSGQLETAGAGNDVYYWTADAPADDPIYLEIVDAVSDELDEDPHPPDTDTDWDEVRRTRLDPVTYPKDETPYGNMLPRWDIEQAHGWVERSGWTVTGRQHDKLAEHEVFSAAYTTSEQGDVTVEYTVVDRADDTAVQFEGIFRRDGDEFRIPTGTPQQRYLATILDDIAVPHRAAALNQYAVEVAEDIDSHEELGAYQDALADLRGMALLEAEVDMATWARRRGQLQGVIDAKEAGKDIPSRFRSSGDLRSLAEQDIETLEAYLEEVEARFDEALFQEQQRYETLGDVTAYLMDEIVREDTRLRQRQWVDDTEDQALLDALDDGRGGKAAAQVRQKWTEYVDAFETRLVDTVEAKLG